MSVIVKKLGELNKNVESLYPCDFTSDFLLLGNSINVPKLSGNLLAFAIKVLINSFIKSHLLNSFKKYNLILLKESIIFKHFEKYYFNNLVIFYQISFQK